MRRFAGIAAIAFAAHSGLAWAQPATGGADEGPRSRVERSAPGDQAPGAGERGGPQQRLERPQGAPRGTQIDERRGEEPQRGQTQRRERPDQAPSPRAQQEQQRDQRQQQRDQAQRERPDPAPNPRAQEQQQQQRDQAQRERQEDRNGRRPAEQAQPDSRSPRSSDTAQPQRPDNRPGTPNTAQPAPRQDGQPQPGTNAQRPDATQPGTSPQPAQNRASPDGQNSDSAQAGNDNQRIADTIRQRVERNEVRPVQNLGVSLSVGAELPSRVQLQPLPSEIAAIRPQYRDYRYTVSDREIVIVDPRSRRIVEVIDRRGGRGGTVDVYATFERQRDVRRWHRPDTVVFRQGVVLPAGVPYHDLPDELIERHPDWRGYQYVMTESEEVAIVEPRTRRIVEVVDKNTSRSAATATSGGSTGASPPPSNGTADRHELARMILADAKPGEIQGIDGLKGAVLPTQIPLRPLPAEVEQQDQQLRGYQYTLIGDDVLIVDPRSREVIEVIE
jgi:hypothetical protein